MKKMLFSIKGILTAMSAMLVLIVSLIASYETAPPADISLGAISGDPFEGPITYSPRSTTTGATQTAITLRAGDFENYGVFNIPHPGEMTITLPATSTFGTLIKFPGQKAEYVFNNLSADTNILFTEGTGMDLEASATSTGGRRIGPSDSAKLVLQRHGTSTDVKAFLTVYDD